MFSPIFNKKQKFPVWLIVFSGSDNFKGHCRLFENFQISDVQNSIYIEGCLQPLQKAFEGHAVIVGAVMGAIIVPVVHVVFIRVVTHEMFSI